MTYYVTAYTNGHARLIVSESRTTDSVVADIIEANLRARGFHVARRIEE